MEQSLQELVLKTELGQVWTPDRIALDMLSMAFKVYGRTKPRKILDPASGPGTFSRALTSLYSDVELTCFDVDGRMVEITKSVNISAGFGSKVFNKDYLLDTNLERTFDLVIMNPPYIRQELIPLNIKTKYHDYLSSKLGEEVDGRSNLFALFLLKAIIDLKPGGVLCAIVYDAINNTQYGKRTLRLIEKFALLEQSKLVQAPFSNVLIDAQILVFRKRKVPTDILFPERTVIEERGTVQLNELLDIRRGTGLIYRSAFIAKEDDPYIEEATHFIRKQTSLDNLSAIPDCKAYLFDDVEKISPHLSSWLKDNILRESGKIQNNLTHLKKMGPILFNYYVRNAPRHLWNPEYISCSDNFYVSSTKNGFPTIVAWLLLNSEVYMKSIISSGRNQGNGLIKLQVFEYKQARVPDWSLLSFDEVQELTQIATRLIKENANYMEVVAKANKQIEKIKSWR